MRKKPSGCCASAVGVAAPPSRTPQVRNGPEAEGFGAGLFPLHSPLLGESSLVSFPPLTDMLKFSGYSRLIRGREIEFGQTGS